jgi:hypothetical protein
MKPPRKRPTLYVGHGWVVACPHPRGIVFGFERLMYLRRLLPDGRWQDWVVELDLAARYAHRIDADRAARCRAGAYAQAVTWR